ncbi:phosphopantothenoylcysteine decarboxylase domain-containing protein [Tautonia sociabilis]|uniref:Phosphopantothenoylcysteine synthase n=1 Tax=Tautonia sociabilis TaxID=2080755 RepID=A0A432MDN5_9BACT|nr:phosphopantothenoylcysteine decarboxylase [Tautonia sociabilis]RUL82952.1 phosphopantothenoylcysteine synthase [Tautonia sociabilis]
MRVLVTGGGTTAPIDDVRHLANASTGRFSAAITEAWLERGASVWHLCAPNAERPFHRDAPWWNLDRDPDELHRRLDEALRRYRAHRDRLTLLPLAENTVAGYARALERTLLDPGGIDVIVLAMAASDYEPALTPGKISSEADELLLRCRKAPKVIRGVRDRAPGAYIVGFKLLSGASEAELIQAAEDSCRVNRVDLTVANDLRRYRAGRHTIHLVRPGHPVETYGPADGDLAAILVDRVSSWAGLPGRQE